MRHNSYGRGTLVVGATGLLGGEICRRLLKKGKPVRALVRATSEKAKLKGLDALGAELVYGDLKDHLSLDTPCRGMKAIISTASSVKSRQEGDSIEAVDREGQLSLVEAAEAAGVEHFVIVSFRNDSPSIQCPLSVAKRMVEERLKDSALTYTILWSEAFMEAWLTPRLGFDYPNARARIYGSGNGKICWISFKDVAQFALASLERAEAQNAVIECGGPKALSPLEVVKIFEEIGGRKLELEYVSEETLQMQRDSAQTPLQESIATLMICVARAEIGNVENIKSAHKTYPLKLTSVRDYAKKVLS